MKKQEKSFQQIFKNSALNFLALTPMIAGVIVLTSLLQAFIDIESYKTLFSNHPVIDTLIGTILGGISVGNGAIGYIFSGELLQSGITIYAASAFMLAWITLGLVQLPMETKVFGLRFTILRNVLTLLSTILVAGLSSYTIGLLQ